MQYSVSELISYLLVYGFMGWCGEVAVMALRTGKFCNRGFFNLPVCPSYGMAMVISIVFLPRASRYPVFSVVSYIIVVSAAAYISGGISRRLLGRGKWRFESISIFTGDGKTWSAGCAWGHWGCVRRNWCSPSYSLRSG